jgi:hypothetical protein
MFRHFHDALYRVPYDEDGNEIKGEPENMYDTGYRPLYGDDGKEILPAPEDEYA